METIAGGGGGNFARDIVRIMAVDDEPVNLKLLEKILQGDGYCNLVLLQDPREVLEQYRSARPDLILLDINMPHLDGYQVLAQLKALNDPLLPPVVILTAQQGKDYLLRALAEGARDFVGKPFDRVELLMRVRNLLDAHLGNCIVHDQKAALEMLVLKSTEELRKTQLEVVRKLGRAAEYRDNETGLHIVRMSRCSEMLARSLGWDDASCELMLNASPMHDIGKIGIPDHILLKPGKFEPHEWEVMKTHTKIGATILAGGYSELIELARVIALTHHEKWDGSGYPEGIKGEAIPQAGRIVAVADVFDALASPRPYKKAWPVDDAVAYIKDNAGMHFDPEVVSHFLMCLPQILAVRARYREPEENKPVNNPDER
ncbi:MAG: response regulator [Nitrosomonadales bacterium]|nr:response regulator [Nitrosomonadales bacterium]